MLTDPIVSQLFPDEPILLMLAEALPLGHPLIVILQCEQWQPRSGCERAGIHPGNLRLHARFAPGKASRQAERKKSMARSRPHSIALGRGLLLERERSLRAKDRRMSARLTQIKRFILDIEDRIFIWLAA